MPRARPPVHCSACDTQTTQPRKGLCNACYLRARRGTLGAQCEVCASSDVRVLRALKLGDGTHTGCHNHAWLAERARPVPADLAAWVEACRVPGDRRQPDDDRRQGKRREPKANNRRGAPAFDLERVELRDGDRRAG